MASREPVAASTDGEGMPTEREWLEGLHGPLAEKPDGDIHDYSDHPDYPSGSNSASVVIPWEDLLGGRDA